jgi:anti-sigma factor RsiW
VTEHKAPPNPIEIVCRELVELVTEYLSGGLSPPDRVRFEKHLLTCPPCTEYLAQIQTTRALAAELGPRAHSTPKGDDVERKLVDLFRRWHGEAD